jgi:hypothetical protein
MPINIAADAEEFRQRSARMNLPVHRAKTGGGMALPGGTGQTSSSRSVSEQTWTPTGQMPVRPEVSTFAAPEWNESEVARNRQRMAGPNIRRLRDVTLQSIGRNYENPNVRRMTVREALRGYGSGLGSILASAQQGAVNEYGNKYQNMYNERMANFNAANQAKMAEYNNLWQMFSKMGTTRTTQSTTGYDSGSSGAAGGSGMGVTSQPSNPRQMGPSGWSPDYGIQKAKQRYAAGEYGPFDVRNYS